MSLVNTWMNAYVGLNKVVVVFIIEIVYAMVVCV